MSHPVDETLVEPLPGELPYLRVTTSRKNRDVQVQEVCALRHQAQNSSVMREFR